MVKYLIQDGACLYTVTGGSLAPVVGNLNAATCTAYGFNDLTGVEELLETLSSPTLFAWSDDQVVGLSGELEGVPVPQNIVTGSVNLAQSSIYSVDEINVTFSGNPLVAIKIDSGDFEKYNGDTWESAGVDGGMTIGTLTTISTEAWTDKFDGATTLQIRVTLTSELDSLTELQFVFLTT